MYVCMYVNDNIKRVQKRFLWGNAKFRDIDILRQGGKEKKKIHLLSKVYTIIRGCSGVILRGVVSLKSV